MRKSGEMKIPPVSGRGAGEAGCRINVRRRLIWCSSLTLILVLAIGCLAVILPEYYYRWSVVSSRMRQISEDRYHRLYGAPLTIKPGFRIDNGRLCQRLYDVGYQLNDHELTRLSFQIRDDRILLYSELDSSRSSYELLIGDGSISRIVRSEDGAELSELVVGRPLLTSFLDDIWEIRQVVPLDAFPDSLTEAVISAEDGSFYRHPGIDIISITRAALVNAREGGVKQGGSTITQQLIKTVSNRVQRTYREKIYEVLLALQLEWVYSKRQILEAYVNNIYLGHVGSYQLRGVAAASYYLLGKNVADLSPGECAVLAAMVRSPNGLSPLEKSEKAIIGAVGVLRLMKKRGVLPGDYRYAADPNLTAAGEWQRDLLLSLSWAWQETEKELQRNNLSFPRAEAAVVEISIDHLMQKDISELLGRQLERLEEKQTNRTELEGAAAVVEQGTGAVRALIGGRDFSRSQFNRATMAQRPIGSLVKPFVYMSAMTADTKGGPITPETRVSDTPLRVITASGPWRPLNYDRKYQGTMTVEQALARSRNVPAVRIGQRAGLERVSDFIRRVGINDAPVQFPSLYLGACSSNVLRMASAYGALANDGNYVAPQLVDRVLVGGSVVFLRRPDMKPVIDGQDSRVMTSMLQKVFVLGTGRSVWKYPVDGEIAGKTGTSSNMRDSWFAGYTPTLTAAVWVGNDANKPVGLTGAGAALPLWAEISGRFGQDYNARFKRPAPPSSLLSHGQNRQFAAAGGRVDVHPSSETVHQEPATRKIITRARRIPAQVYNSTVRQVPVPRLNEDQRVTESDTTRTVRVARVEAPVSENFPARPPEKTGESVKNRMTPKIKNGAVPAEKDRQSPPLSEKNYYLAKKHPIKGQQYRYFNR